MDYTVHVTPKSTNKKTGPIPVTTTERSTCPPSCSWYDKGCYAKYGPLALHWNKVSDGSRGGNWAKFIEWVSELPEGTLWRHNQAGDLPGTEEALDSEKALELSLAAKGTMGFTYTHKDYKKNYDVIQSMNTNGFTVNTSCDTLDDAVESYSLNLPTTVLIPEAYEGQSKFNYKDVVITRCPAEYLDKTCKTCMLCARRFRASVVGFTPHGTGKKHVKEALNG